MKKKEASEIVARIIEILKNDGFDLKSHGIVGFLKPLDKFYRGFCIHPSQLLKESFSVEIFFIPLYIPTPILYFNLGWPLRRKKDFGTLLQLKSSQKC